MKAMFFVFLLFTNAVFAADEVKISKPSKANIERFGVSSVYLITVTSDVSLGKALELSQNACEKMDDGNHFSYFDLTSSFDYGPSGVTGVCTRYK